MVQEAPVQALGMVSGIAMVCMAGSVDECVAAAQRAPSRGRFEPGVDLSHPGDSRPGCAVHRQP
jgi:hypothetical protein